MSVVQSTDMKRPALPSRRCCCGAWWSPSTRRHDDAAHVTYYAERGPYLKIGVTKHFPERLRQFVRPHNTVVSPPDMDPLQPVIVQFTCEGDREHMNHTMWADHHVVGEWFRNDGDLLESAAEANAYYQQPVVVVTHRGTVVL